MKFDFGNIFTNEFACHHYLRVLLLLVNDILGGVTPPQSFENEFLDFIHI
jgi:hypothetical protein